MSRYKYWPIRGQFFSPHVGGEVGHHVAEAVEGAQGELDKEAT